jgi:PAS domain S-box-containing protein
MKDVRDPNEVRAEVAVEAAGMGTWEYNPLTGARKWSSRCKELFGLPLDSDVTQERFLAALHPEDRDRWQAALGRSLDPSGAREYRMEYRTSAHPQRWIASTGRAFFEEGRCVRIMGTVSDITEQKRAEREREIFLGALGHDLRVPLNAITMGADLLLKHGAAAINGANLASRILSSAVRMERMIQDLLDFASSRTGGLQLHPQAVDLVGLCQEVIAEVTLTHREANIALANSGDVQGSWDRDRLAQVVENLVSNAVHHGSEGTPIRVTLSGRDKAVSLQVHNHGNEIPADLRQHLFDPYRRGPTQSKGLGLGLYIASEIVAAHRGTIHLTSDASGTVFTVDLPKG